MAARPWARLPPTTLKVWSSTSRGSSIVSTMRLCVAGTEQAVQVPHARAPAGAARQAKAWPCRSSCSSFRRMDLGTAVSKMRRLLWAPGWTVGKAGRSLRARRQSGARCAHRRARPRRHRGRAGSAPCLPPAARSRQAAPATVARPPPVRGATPPDWLPLPKYGSAARLRAALISLNAGRDRSSCRS
jgi:hypothetical protein